MRFSNILPLVLLTFLSACGSEAPPSPMMKIGKPYEIDGVTYYPEYESSYDKIGMGSWYGPGFHGRKTANGERFNEKDLTAAHPTLPMPSLVRVTNLTNGKSAIVRINDRGPFKKGRIIDLSRASAERVGLRSTMKVRVQYLPKETEDYLADWTVNGKPADMFAYNDRHDEHKMMGMAQTEISTSETPKTSSRFSFISDARADEGEGSITSTDLPAPEKTNAAPPQTLVRPIAPTNMSPIFEREPSDVPFSRGASVAAPAEESVSRKPFKESENARAVILTGEAYYIQAGAFGERGNAQHLVEKLSTLSGATMDKIERSGKEMWRVRVGPFVSKPAANEALETVRQYVPDAHISH